MHLLPPPPAAPLPLLPAARQWAALRATCRAWAALLTDTPLAVEACVPVPQVLPWLHTHVTALRLVPPPTALSLPSAPPGAALRWVHDRCGPLNVDGDEWGVEREAPQVSACVWC